MYICYLDESGTVEKGASTSHFVLIGVAIRADSWKEKDVDISKLKNTYNIGGKEIHTGWMIRHYPEQSCIPNFEKIDHKERRNAVLGIRAMNLARPRTNTKQKELLKNYKKTEPYIHLSLSERKLFLQKLAELINSWDDCRLFGDAQDKKFSYGKKAYDFAFEQIITRFNTFLSQATGMKGIIVQDNNETVCKRLTKKMREYHQKGTFWSKIDNIVETPLFVDSQLTSMVQIADLCAYATRRFFEKNEEELFNRLYDRFDRNKGKLVGLRHYTGMQTCMCRVCMDHGRYT